MTRKLNELTATEIVSAIHSGASTCEAVTRACLDRIAARDADVQAWQYIDPNKAIREARELDRVGHHGPLAGVPFNVKDIIDTFDMPTEYGSAIYRGFRPRADASCVALARKAGALLLGKAVTVEFATTHPARTRNPLDLNRSPGGSSSGSAASVADFMVPLSIGTQGTSSTVKPASFCGVFGYRPTYGDLRCAGVKEAHGSLDTLGILARSVDDVALMRDVLLDGPTRPIAAVERPPRIAFCRTPFWHLLEPSTQSLLEAAAARLARRGAQVFDLTLPPGFQEIEEAHRLTAGFEFTRNYAWEIQNHWEELSETLRAGRIRDGMECTYEEFVDARERMEALRLIIGPLMRDCDVVLAAAATGEAPVGLKTTGSSKPALIWTSMRLPAISVPAFRGPAGLPLGLLLVGHKTKDRDLFVHTKWVCDALS